MPRVILFHKPYGVLSQFTAGGTGHPTLAGYIDLPKVYAVGRLDRDSEGLLVLTDIGRLQHRLADPRFEKRKVYLVQVEREPDEHALRTLAQGVMLKDGMTAPARVRRIEPPDARPARSARALPQERADRLAGAGAHRRPQPPGASHDRRRGLSHPAPGAHPGRALRAWRPGTRNLARRA